MNKKKRLLTIGEIAKFTGSTIKSLRYYEKIGILKPVFINPESGYRYYSFDQMYLIEVIQFCVELDIPLKELMRFIDKNETIDYGALLAYGKEIAEKKLELIQSGLKFIHTAEKEVSLVEQYHQSLEPYSREIEEKFFYVTAYPSPYDDEEFSKTLSQMFTTLEQYEFSTFETVDYGVLYEYSPSEIRRYVFIEVPKRFNHLENIRVIPAGNYVCQQSDYSHIEQAPQIFSDLFKENDSMLVVEAELFAKKYQISEPVRELRAIALP